MRFLCKHLRNKQRTKEREKKNEIEGWYTRLSVFFLQVEHSAPLYNIYHCTEFVRRSRLGVVQSSFNADRKNIQAFIYRIYVMIWMPWNVRKSATSGQMIMSVKPQKTFDWCPTELARCPFCNKQFRQMKPRLRDTHTQKKRCFGETQCRLGPVFCSDALRLILY